MIVGEGVRTTRRHRETFNSPNLGNIRVVTSQRFVSSRQYVPFSPGQQDKCLQKRRVIGGHGALSRPLLAQGQNTDGGVPCSTMTGLLVRVTGVENRRLRWDMTMAFFSKGVGEARSDEALTKPYWPHHHCSTTMDEHKHTLEKNLPERSPEDWES